MLVGLNALDLGRLRMSVGYGGNKKGRPLSPVEVGRLLRRARDEGATLEDCANAVQLDGTGHIGRFLRILRLPEDIQHLIDWGAGRNFVSFTSAVELAKLRNTGDQRAVVQAILAHGLSSKEVRQAVQIRERSGRAMDTCLTEILNMRTEVEKRYVFVGSVSAENVSFLQGLTQAARDVILTAAVFQLGLRNATGRLGPRFFALVGDECFNVSMRKIGKRNIEAKIRSHIAEAAGNETFNS